MDAKKYVEEKERLSQALNGEKNLDDAVTDITDVLTDYNLHLMLNTAFDVIKFALETIYLKRLNFPDRQQIK